VDDVIDVVAGWVDVDEVEQPSTLLPSSSPLQFVIVVLVASCCLPQTDRKSTVDDEAS
jgi:hypothetical protein